MRPVFKSITPSKGEPVVGTLRDGKRVFDIKVEFEPPPPNTALILPNQEAVDMLMMGPSVLGEMHEKSLTLAFPVTSNVDANRFGSTSFSLPANHPSGDIVLSFSYYKKGAEEEKIPLVSEALTIKNPTEPVRHQVSAQPTPFTEHVPDAADSLASWIRWTGHNIKNVGLVALFVIAILVIWRPWASSSPITLPDIKISDSGTKISKPTNAINLERYTVYWRVRSVLKNRASYLAVGDDVYKIPERYESVWDKWVGTALEGSNVIIPPEYTGWNKADPAIAAILKSRSVPGNSTDQRFTMDFQGGTATYFGKLFVTTQALKY
jgi:hypothetical protein